MNRAERLRGLSVGLSSAGRIGVYTGEVLALTLAGLEDTIEIRSRSVELAANAIKDVLAEVLGVGARRVASLETEYVRAHEAKEQGKRVF